MDEQNFENKVQNQIFNFKAILFPKTTWKTRKHNLYRQAIKFTKQNFEKKVQNQIFNFKAMLFLKPPESLKYVAG